MAIINENFTKMAKSYLFSTIAKKVTTYKENNPEKDVISLGIGDVTQPLPPAVIEAMHKAVEDMATTQQFHGYGPEQGYAFLRQRIVEHDFTAKGLDIQDSEVFINDGAKSDTGNIGDILDKNNKVAVTDPVYPVYVDSNVMSGRAGNYTNDIWDNITYLPCTAENNFVPQIPNHKVDMIYLCYPNNPTGTVLSKTQLKEWIDYAIANDAIIFFDAAYEAFVKESDIPRSIYEIEGAKKCAIEFRSFSKIAGFTGIRCGYTVIPHELMALTAEGEKVSVNQLWNRRQTTKFNGASYISQRGAEAIYSVEGQQQVKAMVDLYMNNAQYMRESLEALNLEVYGGKNAPYIWVKTPEAYTSWEFFDKILEEAGVVCTPGVGFGPSGEGYIRLTAFGTPENSKEAIERIKKLF
jgi:LL-diaminopimelate aminotransferase